MPDAHKNFAVSTISTPPSPATTGTSLTVATGDGAKFPAPPFELTVWPAGAVALTINAEIVRVTAIAGDVLTITRQQESSNARAMVFGDQVAQNITVLTLEQYANGPRAATVYVAASNATPAEKAMADYVCDGTFTTGGDEVEINAAYAAVGGAHGGRIALSSGSFFLSSPILLNYSYVQLEGTGIQGTHITTQSGVATAAFSYTGTSTLIFNSLKGFLVDGATTGTYGIYIKPTGGGTFWDFYVRDVFVDQVSIDGIYSYDGHGHVLDHFLAEQCGNAGANYPTTTAVSEPEIMNGTYKNNAYGIIMGCPQGVVKENEIVTMTQDGIQLAGAASKAKDNVVASCGRYGIVTSKDGTVVENNYVYNCTNYGIYLNYRNCLAFGNYVSACAVSGIAVANQPYNVIFANYVNGSHNRGIYVTGNFTTVTGNSVYQSSVGNVGTYDEIEVTGSNCTVIGNTINGSATSRYGVNFSASATTGQIAIGNTVNNVLTAPYNNATADALHIGPEGVSMGARQISNVADPGANQDAATKHYVDVAVAGVVGGGGGGMARSVNNISAPTTAGATAATDYIYLVSGTTTLTLPTAVGNTNLYTVKSIGAGTVTVATTSSQTIDGSASATLPVTNSSLDLISDGANWNVV